MEHFIAFIDNQYIEAFVWTITHSVWQFLLIAVIMSTILKKYQNASASFRYGIAVSSLLIALVVAMFTFFYYYIEGKETIISLAGNFVGYETNAYSYESSSVVSIVEWIKNHKETIALFWLIGFGLYMLRFIVAMVYVEGLAKSNMNDITPKYSDILNSIKEYLGTNKYMKIKECKWINTPMLAGLTKPIVLFPIGLVNQLSDKEVEAILVHEYAHFVRNDMYVNLLLTFIETLFYYHPAVWWISSNIKVERENCCDEIALAYIGDSLLYAKTLVTIQEIHQSRLPALALTFAKKESFFSQRIKRILKMTQTKNYVREKVMMTVAIALLIVIFSKNLIGNKSTNFPSTLIEKVKNVVINSATAINKDTIPKTNQHESISIIKKSNDQDIKLSIINGEVEDLEINGQKIPKEQYGNYQDIIAEVKPGKSPIFFNFNGENLEDIAFNWEGKFNVDSLIGMGMNEDNFSMNMEEWNKQMEKFNHDMKVYNFDMKKFNDQMKTFKFDLKGLDSLHGLGYQLPGFPTAPDFPQGHSFQFGPETHIFQFDPNGEEFEFDFNDENLEFENESDFVFKGRSKNFTETIGNALNRDGLLIPNKENKVELTGKNLKINGEKQPSNIWNKYKRIFEESSGTSLQKNSKIQFTFIGKESNRKLRVF